MNMNCSGHAELRDPDWYDPSRSLDRALNAATEKETSNRMHNSLTSLNIDSLNISDMNEQSFNHFSVRSLPVLGNTGNSTTFSRIASIPDAPWNQSPRSFRGTPVLPNGSNSNITAAGVRPSRANKPPPGVSALDHLQNSLTNIVVSAGFSNSGFPHDIVTLEDDSEYESLAGEQEDSLHESFVSLRLVDVMDPSNNHSEMDETAHTGNVHRAHGRSGNTSNQNSNGYIPSSPTRSPMRSGNINRNTYSDSNLSNSHVSIRSNQSPVRTSHNRHRYNSNNESPSFSTLDEHTEYFNDGCDLGDNEDDNNMDIIKVLRAQIDTLKIELLKQQEQNQKLKHQYEYKNQMSQFLPMDSIVHHGAGGLYDGANDSFVSNQSSTYESKYTDKSQKGRLDATTSPILRKQQEKLSDAENAIFGSIAALKASFQKQQQENENRRFRPKVHEPQPVSSESDDSANILDVEDSSDNAATLSLLDELVLCELEAHVKTMQHNTRLQIDALTQKNEQLQSQILEQTTLIMELERQVQENLPSESKILI